MFNKTPPKGMRDILPGEQRLRESVLEKIKKTYAAYGFSQVETPEVEDLNLLQSKQGGENEKLIYKILKRGEKLEESKTDSNGELCDLGLRYELTLSLARFFANNRGKLPATFKAVQIGNVFRADRPQKGRFRQFVQCDIDILGDDTIFAETELILATTEALGAVGLGGFKIKISDRRLLAALADYAGISPEKREGVFITLDKLDKMPREAVLEEIAQGCGASAAQKLFVAVDEIISGKMPLQSCKKLFGGAANAPVESLENIISAVTTANKAVKIEFDITLVRGMNYYTGTIFEIWTEEASFSLAGGGRYDELISKITGEKEKVPACGFSIGFERVCTVLSERGEAIPPAPSAALLVPKGTDAQTVYAAIKKLRKTQNIGIYQRAKNAYFQRQSLSELGVTEFYTFENGEITKLKND